jgi:hypothetical protein
LGGQHGLTGGRGSGGDGAAVDGQALHNKEPTDVTEPLASVLHNACQGEEEEEKKGTEAGAESKKDDSVGPNETSSLKWLKWRTKVSPRMGGLMGKLGTMFGRAK